MPVEAWYPTGQFLKVLEFEKGLFLDALENVENFCHLSRGDKLDGVVITIEDPAHNFLDWRKEAFELLVEFLLGDRVSPIV